LAQVSREVTRIVRRPKAKLPHWEGFVVGLSKKLVVLHDVDINSFVLNGYKCFRLADVAHGEAIGAPDQFIGRAVRLQGLEPTEPEGIDCSTVTRLLRTAGSHYPLVTIHLERMDPDGCYVGEVTKVGRKWLTLRKISAKAVWLRTGRFRIDDITRVDFGGGYERMLLLVNQTYFSTPSPEVAKVGAE
jgi:hypothetical protein